MFKKLRKPHFPCEFPMSSYDFPMFFGNLQPPSSPRKQWHPKFNKRPANISETTCQLGISKPTQNTFVNRMVSGSTCLLFNENIKLGNVNNICLLIKTSHW